MKAQVQVIRKEITSRMKLLEDRFNVKITVEAKTLGYVAIRNTYFPLPSYNEFYDFFSKIKNELVTKELSYTNFNKKIEELIDFYGRFKRSIINTKQINEFVKLGDVKIIPGSALKGVIRSRLEYRFKPFKVDDDYYSYSCFSVSGLYAGLSQNHQNFWGADTLLERTTCRYKEEESENVCILCDMFGTSGLASRYFFSDLKLKEGEVEKLKEKGDIEAIKPNSIFIGEIFGLNSNFVELGILFEGLELYSDIPVLIGSYKYQHIPKIGKKLFRNGIFGAVKFRIIDYEPKDLASNIDELKEKAKQELDRSDYELEKLGDVK